MKRLGSKLLWAFLICLIIWHMSANAVVTNSASPQVKTISFDYGVGTQWGFCGLNYWRVANESKDASKTIDYVGISDEDEIKLLRNPQDWCKGWVRINISTNEGMLTPTTEFNSRSYQDLLDIEKNSGISDAEHPLFHSNVYIQNVRIQNCELLGIYPKSYMLFSGSAPRIDSIEENKDNHTGFWYMEVLIERRGRMHNEIEAGIQKIDALVDVGVFNEHFKWYRDISIITSDTNRVVNYLNGGAKFQAIGFTLSNDISRLENADFYASTLPVNIINDLKHEPQKFLIVDLDIVADKRMSWGICSLTAFLEPVNENAWVFYNNESDLSLGCNDIWENGNDIPINGFALLLKVDEVERKDVTEIIKCLPIQFSFSTEFAGNIYWDRNSEGKFGYPGMRFTVDLDMHNPLEKKGD